ncbi:phosphotransferase-like protein [Bacillus paramycoides]|uniref:phosphotransferase-like protein n=1 Tax=Bacillus paramycoides TaxID=2026194 RepID=UPI003D1E7925
MARWPVEGAQVIIDDVFISGVDACNRWGAALEGLQVLWVGVFCDPIVASTRESARGDRVAGMAVSQATVVHIGIHYNIKVDTTKTSPEECAQIIGQRINP